MIKITQSFSSRYFKINGVPLLPDCRSISGNPADHHHEGLSLSKIPDSAHQ